MLSGDAALAGDTRVGCRTSNDPADECLVEIPWLGRPEVGMSLSSDKEPPDKEIHAALLAALDQLATEYPNVDADEVRRAVSDSREVADGSLPDIDQFIADVTREARIRLDLEPAGKQRAGTQRRDAEEQITRRTGRSAR